MRRPAALRPRRQARHAAGQAGADLQPHGTAALHRHDRHPRTKELFLSGRSVSAERAERIGLVHDVVDDEAIEPASLELAAEIAANAPLATKGNKRAIETLNSFARLSEEQEQELIALRESCFASGDMREGIKAFAEKRKPKWRGE
ncbi:MAG: enoyl-CoA hydratase-related protein [Actinomycetota bacterium]|nr:enoyl-CoA hydratase-related protein [Actinomycetota bacterium]